MLAHWSPRRSAVLVTLASAAAVLALTGGCNKVPLLAPTGTVITVIAPATTLPLNTDVEIVATVIENGVASTGATTGGGTSGGGTAGGGTTAQPTSTAGAGTPVQNGTVVSFTTTLGSIQPREARTNNGEVRVKFQTGSQSGVATITAYSGGASGKIENLKIGAAAIERLTVTASPQTLGPSGGTAVISAHVEDVNGQGVVSIPVSFTSDAGQLSAPSALTDSNGNASVTLTTAQKATVTASAAGKTANVPVGLNPRTGISIAAPTTNVTAGTPASFTVNVGSGANIRDVTVNFGDGSRQSLGAISGSTTISHTYAESGTYVVTATATDTSGFAENVNTAVTVLPAQPPSVVVQPSNSNPTIGEVVIVTATVSGNTSTITGYDWNFGNSATPSGTIHTTSNRVPVSWATTGTKVITVTATQASGPSGDGIGTVTVRATLR